jgi:thymidylate synthase (FAD)
MTHTATPLHKMHTATLVHITPKAEELISYMARVSNPSNQSNTETSAKLIRYLIKHKHFSPFEMVNMCVEINTTRSIAAQILRHRSFTFQEFSQRYAKVATVSVRCRTTAQDHTNRQNSIDTLSEEVLREADQVAAVVLLRVIRHITNCLNWCSQRVCKRSPTTCYSYPFVYEWYN